MEVLAGENLSQMNSHHLPSLPPPRAVLRALPGLHSEDCGLESPLGPEDPSKANSHQDTSGQALVCPFSSDGHTFPQGKNTFLGSFHNIFSLYNVLYLKNENSFL